MRTIIIIFISLLFCTSTLAEMDLAASKSSDNGHFQVRYISKLEPIEINNLHAWIIHIKDKDGNDIPNAEVNVIGGMPEHNHGLPTQPQITKDLGDGCYLLEGMKFHMLGWWTVTVSITIKDISDVVTFNLKL
ncbi:MAG: Auxin-binding protein [Gammaproteobacteria bacterium]|nr:MAG: Auxin-binding protein [Gammaproteobacteria bacterium]